MSAATTVNAGSVSVSTQARYNSVLPTYVNGASTELQTDSNGILLIKDTAAATSLTAIQTSLSNIETYVDGLEGFTDGLEGLATSLNGFVDGLEGFTDGIEGLLTTGNASLASIAAEDFATETTLAAAAASLVSILAAVDGLEGFTDGIEGLITSGNASLTSLAAEDFATETTLAAMSAKLPAALGQTTMANSLAVVIASNQSSIPVTGPLTDTELRASAVPVSVASLPLPTGASTSALQTTGNSSLSSIDGKLPAVLGQAAMAASLSVVVASNQSTIPVSMSVANSPYLSVVDQIDTSPGPVLDASANNIQDNAGAFLTVVASLAANVKKIRVADTTGEFIGVYTGPAASEVLAFIINPGQSNEIEHSIPAGTRVSLRSMGVTDITSGLLAMQFLG